MDRLNGKMGAGSGNVLDATMASKDIIKGLLIDLTFLVDTWNPEVKDLPPEKVIRDFNVFLFSGKYDLFVTDTLANTISHLDDKKIETFSSLLIYYFSAYGEKDCKEKKLIQNFVNEIIKGLERQSRDRETGQGFLKSFINNQTTKWSLDDDHTQKEIEESLNEALNKRNNNASAIIGSVNKKIELKQFQEGIIQANKGLEIHKDNLLLYVARARCFYESGHMESAINDFTKSIELDNDLNNSLFHKYRGLAKLQINDKEGAFNDFKIAAGRGNDDAKELLNIYFKNKVNLSNTRKIEESQTETLDINLNNYFKEGNQYLNSRNFIKAIEAYSKYLSIEKNENVFFKRGLAKLHLEDFTSAIDDYKKAIKLDPSYAQAYYNIGLAKVKLEDFLGAIKDFDKAIELDDRDDESYYHRANVKAHLDNFGGAIDDYSKAIEINPTQELLFLKRGSAKSKLEDFEGSIDDFTKAIKINPADSNAYKIRGAVKWDFAVAVDDDKKENQLCVEAILDYKKSSELGNESAKQELNNLEESLSKVAKSDSKSAEDCARLLREHFDKEISLNDEVNKNIIQDISKRKEDKKISSSSSTNKPIKRDAIQNVLETELDNFNPTYKTWATFKALKRLAWVMEDDGSDEEELYSFLLSSYKNVSSPEKFTEWIKELLYDKSYSNNDPEWLESEWNIGPDVELHAFNSKESFLKSFDNEFTYSIFNKCWEIACSEDLYKLNDYENWNNNKYWFFKNKIWIITSEQVNKYYLKNDALKKLLDASQLESFYNYEIGNGISVLEISGVKEVGEKLNWMDKRDLIKFHELPLELLDNLEQRPTSKEESNGEGYTKNSTGELIHESDPLNIFTSNNSGDTHLTRVNNLLLKFWEFTPFYEKETIPIVLVSKGEDNSVNFSYSRGTKDNPLPPASCFYSIFDDGKVKVKETNEVLNLNDFSHLMAIISTIIRDIYGDYESEGVTLKFMESFSLGKDDFNNFDEKEENKNLEKDDFELDIAPLGILPGGYYWIGDPSNIKENYLSQINTNDTKGGCFYLKDGIACAFFETASGDGIFKDQKSTEYIVDSGWIACIPIEKVPEDADEFGIIWHITNPFVCQYINNGGFICFGEVAIKTDLTKECSFPEPLKIEELGALKYGQSYLYENDCGEADSWTKWASNIEDKKLEDQSFKAAVEMYAKVKNAEISPQAAFNFIVEKYGEKCASGSFMAIYSYLDSLSKQSKSKEIDLSDAVSSQKDVVMEYLIKHYSKEYLEEITNDKNKTNEEIEEYLFSIWLERNNSLVKKLSAWVEHKVFVHKNS